MALLFTKWLNWEKECSCHLLRRGTDDERLSPAHASPPEGAGASIYLLYHISDEHTGIKREKHNNAPMIVDRFPWFFSIIHGTCSCLTKSARKSMNTFGRQRMCP